MKPIVFATGATGGHVYPAVAIAQSLENENVVFFTTRDREDFKILSRYDVKIKKMLCPLDNLVALVWAFFSVMLSFLFNRPKCVVITGGGTTAVVVVGAIIYRIPIVLCEQNVLPGRVIRAFSRFATKVCVSFEETRAYLRGGEIVCTGNPVRKNYLGDDDLKRAFKDMDTSLKTILVFGGSQGAQAINNFIMTHFSEFLEASVNIVLVSGRSYFKDKGFGTHFLKKTQAGKASFFIIDYTEAMDMLYEQADLVVSRAGATSISELIFFHKPAVLVPYPYAMDDHQLLNAKEFVNHYPGKVCPQDELSVDVVLTALHESTRATFEKTSDVATERVAAVIKSSIR
ncbi:hypothetical protein DID80_02350 [Candidatus Marinamargulisbacteria bacterium SCGC AAA071-K20]|nr:hypothetical protein DID80_02350 [Candidatus Marinamargulisbacteria bacterium SCGC AAA071-K20]